MTSFFDADGKNIPCTVIEAGPCVITQVKTTAIDGYEAVQVAYGEKKDKHTTAALKGHFAKASTTAKRKVVEFSGYETEVKLGDTIDASIFAEGDIVEVVGTSKGKGFQGVIKRHGFGGVGGATHGQHNRLRAPGSLGASSFPAKVFKGMRMAGQQGNVRVKTQNLEVLKVIADQNIMVIKGALPGATGSYIIVEK